MSNYSDHLILLSSTSISYFGGERFRAESLRLCIHYADGTDRDLAILFRAAISSAAAAAAGGGVHFLKRRRRATTHSILISQRQKDGDAL